MVVGSTELVSYDIKGLSGDAVKATPAAFSKSVNEALASAGYPAPGKPADGIVKLSGVFDVFNAQAFPLVLLLTYLVILVTMVYGPIAAALVERMIAPWLGQKRQEDTHQQYELRKIKPQREACANNPLLSVSKRTMTLCCPLVFVIPIPPAASSRSRRPRFPMGTRPKP